MCSLIRHGDVVFKHAVICGLFTIGHKQQGLFSNNVCTYKSIISWVCVPRKRLYIQVHIFSTQ